MLLRDLIAVLSPLRVEGNLDREVMGLAYDSRRVTPGMVFFALRGQNVDGHQFVPSAIDRGAIAIVCETNGFGSQKAAKIAVRDCRQAMARAAALFYQRPATRLDMVGITGTNGKTTVSFMVKRILEAAGLSVGLMGTVRYEIGDRTIPAQRTTPESLEIQQMLAQMAKVGCRACVMEVSSHALEQRRVDGISFTSAAFTNLTQDHLDYHGNMEAYFAAKRKLFAEMLERGGRGRAVINFDDPYGQKLIRSSTGQPPITYGFSAGADLRLSQLALAASGCEFLLEHGRIQLECRLPLIGRFNAYNAAAALGVARHLGIDLKLALQALATMPGVPGRLEPVDAGQPFAVYVDYAHTDDALGNVLRTVKEVAKKRVLLVFGCGGSRDTGKRPKMGRVAAGLADHCVITSDNPRREQPSQIAQQIEAGFREVRQDGVEVELDRRRAIERILRSARPQDLVVIAGKGHESYQEFEDTVVPFDDRIVATEILAALGYRKEGRRA